jgi:hypothetical protein
VPKSVQIDQRSSVSPDELEARLRETTRWSLVPYQGSPFGGRAKLRGRIRGGRVNLGLAERDLLTLLQPTLRGHIEPTADGGSRLVGELGVPAWVIWLLRFAFLVIVPGGILAAGFPLVQDLGPTGWVAAAAFAVVAVLATMFGIGLQLAHAETLLPKTEAVIAGLTEGEAGPTTPQLTSEREVPSRARAAAKEHV